MDQMDQFEITLAGLGYQRGGLDGLHHHLTPLAMRRLRPQAVQTVWDGTRMATQIVRANGNCYACHDGSWWLVVKVV